MKQGTEKFSPEPEKEKQRGVFLPVSRRLFLVSLVVACFLLLVAYGAYAWWTEPRPDPKKWQAVFFTNGQVYFGKLSIHFASDTLTNIYYLQAPQQLQQPAGQNTTVPNFNLVKLGDELHGPEDKMVFSRDKVLFWENLKDSSKVVGAIGNLK